MSDIYPALRATLAELVAIDSTSVRSNRRIIEYLETRLLAAGFLCQRQSYRDESGEEKINLLAQKGTGHPELALVGHSDCVPFDGGWKEALTLTERDGNLYGRGACDTKAFIAGALLAAERATPHKPLLLAFTADEELGCLGAKRMLDEGLGKARYAIVGEPTSLRPIRANKGYCLAEVEISGKEGHSAYPDSGASAIFRAGRFLHRLEQLALTELRQSTHPDFDPPFTTVNVGVISGGKAKNIIPGRCVLTIEWRPIPNQAPEVGLALLERIRAELTAAEPGYRAQIHMVRSDSGVDTPASSAVVEYLAAQSGKEPETVAFGTEAPHMTRLGAEAVVFGPGNIQVAHQTGEFVPVEELVRCEEILRNAIAHFCG